MASYYRAMEEQWAEGTLRIRDASVKADVLVAAARSRQAENAARLDTLRVCSLSQAQLGVDAFKYFNNH